MSKLNKVNIEIDYSKPVVFYEEIISEEAVDPDSERLDKALAGIDASLANWDQTQWAVRKLNDDDEYWFDEIVVAPTPECGTAMCLAGQVVVQAGYYIAFQYGHAETNWAVDKTGLRHEISSLARKLLGLTVWQANQLFSANNDRGELQRVRDKIVNGDFSNEEEWAE